MTSTEVTEDGYYWMKLPHVNWHIVKATFIEMDGFGKVLHVLKFGETWHVPVKYEAEFQGPIPKPS